LSTFFGIVANICLPTFFYEMLGVTFFQQMLKHFSKRKVEATFFIKKSNRHFSLKIEPTFFQYFLEKKTPTFFFASSSSGQAVASSSSRRRRGGHGRLRRRLWQAGGDRARAGTAGHGCGARV
jgi:hypothetical protein